MDDLHVLIQSMTAAEKRFFMLQVGAKAPDSTMLRIYRCLENQDIYSELALRTELAGDPALRQLAVAKNHLKERLLKNLLNFHQGKSVQSVLREMLEGLEIFEQKGMYRAQSKLLNRAWKKASLHQEALVMLELLRWRMRQERRLNAKLLSSRLNDLSVEYKMVLKELEMESDLRILHDELFVHIRQGGPESKGMALKQVDEALTHPLVAKKVCQFFNARVIRGYIRVWAGYLKGDFGFVEQAYLEMIWIWDANPHQVKERSQAFMKLLYAYLDACLHAKQFRNYVKVLVRLRKLPIGSRLQQAQVFFFGYHLELRYLIHHQKYKEAFELLPGIMAGLEKHQSPWGDSGELTFFHNIAVVCLNHARFKEALPWVNRVLNHPKVEVRADLQSVAGLFLLLIHWELENHDLLAFLLRNRKRSWRKATILGLAEASLVKGWRDLLKSPNSAGQKAIFQRIRQEIPQDAFQGLSEVFQLWLDRKASSN